MTRTIEAVFDGDVLRPTQPLDIEPNTTVRVVVDTDSVRGGILAVAAHLMWDTPDGSEAREDGLYEEV